MLIIVGVWMLTGFAMVILSAGLKGIRTELLEAARVDGATELQVFRQVIMPLLAPTIAVVATTMIIFALKTFDVVYVMTNGNFDTEVIANRMYKELFTNGQQGRAAAVAVVLLAAIVPVMILNISRFSSRRTCDDPGAGPGRRRRREGLGRPQRTRRPWRPARIAAAPRARS